LLHEIRAAVCPQRKENTMIFIHSRNVDGLRVRHDFDSPEEFIEDWESDNPSMDDNEILLVVLLDRVIYSSLGSEAKKYDDTLRTAGLYDWLR